MDMNHLLLLLFVSSMIPSAQSSVAAAGVCTPACATVVVGGASAVIGALTVSGVGAALIAPLAAALSSSQTLTVAGCTAACIESLKSWGCFDQYAHVEVPQNGAITDIPIHLLQKGDEVRSVNEKSTGTQVFARVTHISKTSGNFLFYQLDFDNERRNAINVTAPHLMILCEEGNDVLGTKSAWSVKAGDAMLVINFDKYGNTNRSCTKVRKVTPFYANEKINVETDSGTILANGVFVTGICENNEGDNSGEAAIMLSKYRQSHGYGNISN